MFFDNTARFEIPVYNPSQKEVRRLLKFTTENVPSVVKRFAPSTLFEAQIYVNKLLEEMQAIKKEHDIEDKTEKKKKAFEEKWKLMKKVAERMLKKKKQLKIF